MRARRPKAKTPPPPHLDQRLRGIGLMCIAIVFFATIDTLAKYLVHQMPTLQVVWGRYAFAFLLGYFLYNPAPLSPPGRALLGTKRPWVQLTRGLLQLLCTFTGMTGVYYLRLDQVLAIMFSTPFFVAALSIPLLGEHVGPRRWAAIAVGFLGVLVVIRPGFGGIHPAAFLTLVCAVSYALFSIVTRILARQDASETTLFYSNLLGTVVMMAVLPFVWTWPASAGDFVLLVLLGCVGTIGHFLQIRAHRIAPASVLSPFIYTQLVWAILAGYIVFGDLPDRWTLAGCAIVITSGLYLLYRERRVRGESAPPSADPVA
jgi:drug/metabolite transporter (DMT)-like permease